MKSDAKFPHRALQVIRPGPAKPGALLCEHAAQFVDPFEVAAGAFATDAPAMLDEIDSAIGDADAGTVRRIAHTVKSNAATFGARSLSEACRQLEHAAKAGNLDGAPGLAQAIRVEYDRARIELGAAKASLTSD